MAGLVNTLPPHVPNWGKRTWKNVCLDCGNYRNNANDYKRHIYKEKNMIAAIAAGGLHENWIVERCKPTDKGEKVRLRNTVTGELSGWASVVESNELFAIYELNVGKESVFPDTFPDIDTTPVPVERSRQLREELSKSYTPGGSPAGTYERDAIQDDETTREEHDEVAEVINMPSPAQDELDMQHLINEEEFSKFTVRELKEQLKEVYGGTPAGISTMKKADLINRLLFLGAKPRG